ncbi:MAG: hypothetical protein ACO3YX_07020 [Candidatus Nanopelagicaceae bacterium]
MKIQHLWSGTAGGISVLFSGLSIAQAVEVVQPYTPQDLQVPDLQLPDLLLQDVSAAPTPKLLPQNTAPGQSRVGLSFDLPVPVQKSSQPDAPQKFTVPPSDLSQALLLPEAWWRMGHDSPIAIAIGMAEGTRTLNGGKTSAYYWHEDPGNGANNFGTFSYQHLPQAKTDEVDRQASATAKREVAKEQGLPELSDRLQLQRLEKFYRQLQQQAKARGIELTHLEVLNGLDLANQSEAAALSAWGYIDRLVQMRSLLPGQVEEQILEARTWSYWSPDRNTWDAPGLGNRYENIRQDQNRRFKAVKAALQAQALNHQARA